ncbi:hypothetical protein MNEG_15032, partial [Monoraphidium neglectum]
MEEMRALGIPVKTAGAGAPGLPIGEDDAASAAPQAMLALLKDTEAALGIAPPRDEQRPPQEPRHARSRSGGAAGSGGGGAAGGL